MTGSKCMLAFELEECRRVDGDDDEKNERTSRRT